MFEVKDHQVFIDNLQLPYKRNKGSHRAVVLQLRMEPDVSLWPESALALAQIQKQQLARNDEGEQDKDTIKVQFVRDFPRAEYELTVLDADFIEVCKVEFGADVKGSPTGKLVKGVFIGCWNVLAHLTPNEVGQISQAVGSETCRITIKLAQQTLPFNAEGLPGEQAPAEKAKRGRPRKAQLEIAPVDSEGMH
jgi:hypothetical protein